MSSVNSSTPTPRGENEFCLSGSQINLSCRPSRSNNQTLLERNRRPLSAQYAQSHFKKEPRKLINRKRPKSADNHFLYNSFISNHSIINEQKQRNKLENTFLDEFDRIINKDPCVRPGTFSKSAIELTQPSKDLQLENYNKQPDSNWAVYTKSERKNDNINGSNLKLESINSLDSFSDQSFNLNEKISKENIAEFDNQKEFFSNNSQESIVKHNETFEIFKTDKEINEKDFQENHSIHNLNKEFPSSDSQKSSTDHCCQKDYFCNDYDRDLIQGSTILLEQSLTNPNNDPELDLLEAEKTTDLFLKQLVHSSILTNKINEREKINEETNCNINSQLDSSKSLEFTYNDDIKDFESKEDLIINAKNEEKPVMNETLERRNSIHVRFDLRQHEEKDSRSYNRKNKIIDKEKKEKKVKSKLNKAPPKAISNPNISSSRKRDASSSSEDQRPRQVPEPEKLNLSEFRDDLCSFIDDEPLINEEVISLYKNDHSKEKDFIEHTSEKNNLFLHSHIINEQMINSDYIAQSIHESGDKLHDILNYLDQVDERCDHVLEIAKARVQNLDVDKIQKSNYGDFSSLELLLNSSTVDLAHEIITLRLQIEEKENCIGLLQKTLNQQRDLNNKNNKNAEKELKTRLKEQKKYYETITVRHQKFINQIIEEKTSLNEKCESLLSELQRCQERFKKNLRAAEERHSLEIKRLKERQVVGEKARRTRWVDQNAQALKEATVRGLEPELERISHVHQQELMNLRALHRREIENLELRAARNTQQQMAELREMLERDKEEAIARECNALRQKLTKEETNLKEEREKINSEIIRIREKFNEEEQRLHLDLENIRASLERETKEAIKASQSECQAILASTERRHQLELQTAKESSQQEFNLWKSEYQQKQSKTLELREAELKEEYKKLKETEMNMLNDRLEEEIFRRKEEIEAAADAKIKRTKEKLEKEISEMELLCENYKSKYSDIKRSFVEKDEEILEAQAQVRIKEKETNELTKLVEKYSSERIALREYLSQEFKDRILEAEGEAARLRQEIVALRQSQREEEISIKSEAEQELNTVYQRVKSAIAKKDLAISKLRAKCETSEQRIHHLEALLEQNRLDYLKCSQKN